MIENTLERLEQEIPALRRFARALVGHPERADDLVQDTLERALTRLDSYTPGTNMRAWLFTILRNAHINELRRARTTTAPDETLEALSPPAPAGQDHGLAMRDLQRALAQLTPEMREVLLLIGLEGLSYEEAADVLGAKVGTVKSRLCRGREALRRLMDGDLKLRDKGPHPAELLVFPRLKAALEQRRTAPAVTAAEHRRATG